MHTRTAQLLVKWVAGEERAHKGSNASRSKSAPARRVSSTRVIDSSRTISPRVRVSESRVTGTERERRAKVWQGLFTPLHLLDCAAVAHTVDRTLRTSPPGYTRAHSLPSTSSPHPDIAPHPHATSHSTTCAGLAEEPTVATRTATMQAAAVQHPPTNPWSSPPPAPPRTAASRQPGSHGEAASKKASKGESALNKKDPTDSRWFQC